ncbi:ABC transporter ATP-binding protein [Lentibacillus sp. Marseille-P4043]|uniref:ABC transporter ATP-binding protein n=1 Tax=Lentibacillus sp. Marseille-P4043 TaxID=2040293 RepID=UPI000D0B8A46|nr:phosphate ABC transporter ATP-binding protein [Lentibacillus sp. Marseille-P4043]
MTTKNNIAIQFNEVSYSSDGMQILSNITGSFPEGSITTLVGPSGAGKSTLFKLCNGLQSPNSGEIYIKEKNINDYVPTELRRNVGMALQQATMVSGSVQKNLALPLELKGEQISADTAKDFMNMVGLDETYLQRNVKDLSGGQRQKLSIARTLVNRPQILLLDEITSSLDRVSQQDIEKLIININEKYSTTIIWITHNLQQAREIGHYTWVMMAGEVVESGETSLLDSPKTEPVQQFIKGEEQ